MADGRERATASHRPRRPETIVTSPAEHASTASRASEDPVQALGDHVSDGSSQGSTGMGAFGDGDFQGGTSGVNSPRGKSGYGQDAGLPGGYGEGSGFAQSSDKGGYGQGATQQGGRGQSGSEQDSDERYGKLGDHGEQRSSPYGYGGQGSQQQDGKPPAEPRGQHHGKGSTGHQRTDDRIREDVSEHLGHAGQVDASEIEIQVTSGAVTLTGTVSSREEKRRAEEVSERCSGVVDVQNRLRIKSHAAS